MAEFVMPSLGADMETGTISEWLVKPGERIDKGDPIAVIDTDKAIIEVESFVTGVVDALLVEPGERVPVGTALAVISEPIASPAGAATAVSRKRPARAGPDTAPPKARPVPPQAPPARASEVATTADSPVMSPLVRHEAERHGVDLSAVAGSGPGGRVTRADVLAAAASTPFTRRKASPLARRLAIELGIDLAAVSGTGRTGAIRAQDVRRAVKAAQTEPPTEADRRAGEGIAGPPSLHARTGQRPARRRPSNEEGDRHPAVRQAIARAMSRSKREIPHYYLSCTTDMGAALTWLRALNKDLPVSRRVLPAALLLKAAARAATEVPRLNGFWQEDRFVPGTAVHLGVAIALKDGGLIAPALHDTAGRDLVDLMAELKDLVSRARNGRLREAEMTEATITVTNLGDQGVESVYGVIYPPQVALVGFGKIVERPWAVNGLLGVRPLVKVTLSADHRATDGYTGARFLAAVDRLLTHPEDL